jgi:hypothetical protein
MLLICMVALAGLALAQAKVDGDWKAEIQGGRGPQMVTFSFKTEGGKLTGTYTGGPGRGGAAPMPVMLEDVSLKGTTLTFTRKQMGRNGETTFKYTGMVKGDSIDFTMEGGQMPVMFTAKKG